MTRPDDHETAAIERLLANRSRPEPSPELRTRVLAAVQNQKVPATTSGKLGDSFPPHAPDLVAGTFWFGTFWMALSLVLVVTLSSAVAWQRGGASADRPLLSLARRAEAAGIALDLDPPAAERLASAQPHDAAGPHRGDILHVLDAHTLLKGAL